MQHPPIPPLDRITNSSPIGLVVHGASFFAATSLIAIGALPGVSVEFAAALALVRSVRGPSMPTAADDKTDAS